MLALVRCPLLLLAAVHGTSPAGFAQCDAWDTGFGLAGTDDAVFAMLTHDAGSGPSLHVAGSFRFAGTAQANRLARWDGAQWRALGPGANDWVFALASFDDGSGPALYAGGRFTSLGTVSASRIVRWNGTTWSPLGSGIAGTGSYVRVMAVYDPGSGPALYAGGAFSTAGGVPCQNIARWSGSGWSPLGTGVGGSAPYVSALAAFDDGTGPALYVGGAFTTAGGVPAQNIARWDGASWSALGGGVSGVVHDIVAFDDGTGAALYVGGDFRRAGGAPARDVARWDGSSWSSVGASVPSDPDTVFDLEVYDDGSGPALYAVGSFTSAGGASCASIARWNGASWTPVAGGLAGTAYAATVHDSGSGAMLCAGGGDLTPVGGPAASNVAGWNGTGWSAFGAGAGLDGDILAFGVYDEGSGPRLFASGNFEHAGGAEASRIARWDGASWSALGTGLDNHAHALAVFDDGSGPALYAGGELRFAGGVDAIGIARWDGTSWSALGGGAAIVDALTVFDDGTGSALYVGGYFPSAGGIPAQNVARWDGAGWSGLGSGVSGEVMALAVFDDGSGPALYAGGSFAAVGGVPAGRIARWDGASWTTLGSGLNNTVSALCVYDDGNGKALYAAGNFTQAGGLPTGRIARWDGVGWSPLGSGLNGWVRALTVFDDGSGEALYAGGSFTQAGGVAAGRIARWDGSVWSSIGSGTVGPFGTVYALAAFDDGGDGDADLFAGGSFATVDDTTSLNIARWHGCGVSAFCFGDGSAAACPCANRGASGHGCENSASTGGALLAASGSSHPDALVLTSSGELASALSIFLQGDAQVAPVAFGDGLRCAGGNLKRLYSLNAAAGTASAPQPGDPSITARSAALGDPIAPGSSRFYQVYYRDPDASFCASPQGSTFNASNALRIVW